MRFFTSQVPPVDAQTPTTSVLTFGFSGDSGGRDSVCNAGDPGLIPGSGNPLEKEMTAHSSILAWRNPWIEEPGGL